MLNGPERIRFAAITVFVALVGRNVPDRSGVNVIATCSQGSDIGAVFARADTTGIFGQIEIINFGIAECGITGDIAFSRPSSLNIGIGYLEVSILFVNFARAIIP